MMVLTIKCIDSNINERHVTEYFKDQYDIDVVDVELKATGFVTFASGEQVDRVCQKQFHCINGRMVEAKKVQRCCAIPSGQPTYAAAYQHMATRLTTGLLIGSISSLSIILLGRALTDMELPHSNASTTTTPVPH